MDKPNPVCQVHFIEKSSLQRHLLVKAPLDDALESEILKAEVHSGSCVVSDWLHFPQVPGLHVENTAAHGDVFVNPRVRPNFLDLLAGIYFGVLVGEEAHRSRRSITGRIAQLRVELSICEGGKTAACVVEKQYLSSSEHAGGNDKLTENIFCYRRSAGPDNVDIGLRQTQDSREV